mmetsp:Transcript_28878/g.92230  ORF Transcript_28878/g.92230 Transcript_28878/m.92230 type:complete len:82 (-) Transcript_28878:1137-1382(-)
MMVLTEAYATIAVAEAAAFLGSSEQEAIQAAMAAKWELDASGAVLIVKKPQAAPGSKTGPESLQQLVEYVVHLSENHASVA